MRACIALCVGALTACNGTMESYFAQDVVEIILDEPYVEGTESARQYLDLYLPRGVDRFPVVVFVHGGYWIAQDKNYFQPFVGLYRNVGIALARRGIGTAVINYRLVPDVTFAEQFADVTQALRWVHDHAAQYGGDPARMVMAGHSAGGHMTALAAFDTARVAAAGVDVAAIRGYAPLSPILDLEAMAVHPPSFNAEITAQVFGTALAENSPRTYFKRDVAPVFLMMGDGDKPFLVEQIPAGVTELEALGAPVTFATLAGTDHDDVVLDFDTDGDQVTPLLAAFVDDVTR